jgi:hypothetical protein
MLKTILIYGVVRNYIIGAPIGRERTEHGNMELLKSYIEKNSPIVGGRVTVRLGRPYALIVIRENAHRKIGVPIH